MRSARGKVSIFCSFQSDRSGDPSCGSGDRFQCLGVTRRRCCVGTLRPPVAELRDFYIVSVLVPSLEMAFLLPEASVAGGWGWEVCGERTEEGFLFLVACVTGQNFPSKL